MSEQILVNFTPAETRVAVMDQGVVQEVHAQAILAGAQKDRISVSLK